MNSKGFSSLSSQKLAIFAIVLIAAIFLIGSSLTGAFFGTSQTHTQQLDLTITQSQDYGWVISEDGQLRSVSLTGSITGNGNVKVYLNDGEGQRFLILDSILLESRETETSGLSIAEIEPQENETEEILNVTGIENITEPVVEQPQETIINFDSICVDTCSLPDGFDKKEYTLSFELDPNTIIHIDSIIYTLESGVPALSSVVIKDSAENTVQGTVNIDENNAEITFTDQPVSKIKVNNVRSDFVEIGLEEIYDIERLGANADFNRVYAIDLSRFDFDTAEITTIAQGPELYKCKNWNFQDQKCLGNWVKLRDLVVGEEYTFTLTKTDPGMGEGKGQGGGPPVSFDRDLDCHKCGKHKAPPLTDVTMTISATVKQPVLNATFNDLYHKDWYVVEANGGAITEHNTTYNKISWHVGDVTDSVSKVYVIHSPERTLPPTNYYFISQLNEYESAPWRVVIADPPDLEFRFPNTYDDTNAHCTDGTEQNVYAIDGTDATCTAFLANLSTYWWNNTAIASTGTIHEVRWGVRYHSNTGTPSKNDDLWSLQYGIATTPGTCTGINYETIASGAGTPGTTYLFPNVSNTSAVTWTDINNTCWRYETDVNPAPDNWDMLIDNFNVWVNYTPPAGVLNITLEQPTALLRIGDAYTFRIIGRVACLEASCGEVTISARYNTTGAAADTIIPASGTNLDTFDTNPFNCGTMTAGTNCTYEWNVSIGRIADWNIDVNASSGTVDVLDNNSADILVNISTGVLNMSRSIAPTTITIDENFTANATIACRDGLCFNVFTSVRYNVSSDADPDTVIPISGTPLFSNPNTFSCTVNMTNTSVCAVNYSVNGSAGGDYWIDINASSDEIGGNVLTNNSANTLVTVNPKPGVLNITMEKPPLNVYINDTYHFNISGRVACVDGDCGTVTLSARYNLTGGGADTIIPTIDSGQPFIVVAPEINPYNCGTMNQNDICTYEWNISIKRTGDFDIDVNTSSGTTDVLDNETIDARITVLVGTLNVTNYTIDSRKILLDENFTINATIACMDGLCFDVLSNVRYNTTNPATGDTVIPLSGTPLFADPNGIVCGTFMINMSTCTVNYNVNTSEAGHYMIDINFSSTDPADGGGLGAGVQSNDTAATFITVTSGILNITFEKPTATMIIGDTYSIGMIGRVACIGGSCGTVTLSARYNTTSASADTVIPGSGTYLDTFNTNPFNCGAMSWGDNCTIGWNVSIGRIADWNIDVNASSGVESVLDNNSADILVNISTGVLNMSRSIAPTTINQNENFTANATIACRDGLCFNVFSSVRYNVSSDTDPDTVIPTSGTPLFSNPNTFSCTANMSNTSVCAVNYSVNGSAGGDYYIDINASSDEIEKVCDIRVIAEIPYDERVPESISVKIPVTLYAPRARASIALRSLAAYLCEKGFVARLPKEKKGFFSRVFGRNGR